MAGGKAKQVVATEVALAARGAVVDYARTSSVEQEAGLEV
jgi:hypothetical protein